MPLSSNKEKDQLDAVKSNSWMSHQLDITIQISNISKKIFCKMSGFCGWIQMMIRYKYMIYKDKSRLELLVMKVKNVYTAAGVYHNKKTDKRKLYLFMRAIAMFINRDIKSGLCTPIRFCTIGCQVLDFFQLRNQKSLSCKVTIQQSPCF